MTPKTDQPGFVSNFLVRRALHLYWRFARGMTMGVRAVLLDRDNRVFLIRHTYLPGWHLPGGGVEAGETTLDALTREVREEASIAIAGAPVLHGVFFNARVSRRDHVLVYVVRDFEVLGPKQPDREIAEAGFFPLDNLPEGVTAATQRRLAEILHGAAIAGAW
jgi:8-oxo-dGTP pyrophosphatase MutT (NUDIX family)